MKNPIRSILRPVMEGKRRDNGFPPTEDMTIALVVIVFSLLVFAMCLMPSRSEGAEGNVYDTDAIADAIYIIEGGKKARKPYGVLSVPCNSEQSCRKICKNTINNNFTRWQIAGSKGDFLQFLADVYAPIGAGNDPSGLNRNWIRNLRDRLRTIEIAPEEETK